MPFIRIFARLYSELFLEECTEIFGVGGVGIVAIKKPAPKEAGKRENQDRFVKSFSLFLAR